MKQMTNRRKGKMLVSVLLVFTLCVTALMIAGSPLQVGAAYEKHTHADEDGNGYCDTCARAFPINESGKKIYFDNSLTKWSQVYMYSWTDNVGANAAWPGIRMTRVEGDLYEGITPYDNVIFTNYSGVQTPDLMRVDSCTVWTYSSISSAIVIDERHAFTAKVTNDETLVTPETADTNAVYRYSCADCGMIGTETFEIQRGCTHEAHDINGGCMTCPSTAEHIYIDDGNGSVCSCGKQAPGQTDASKTVYFDNSASNWESVYAYAWDGPSISNATWPGVSVTDRAGDLYAFSMGEYTNLIFNNGNNGYKTADITDFANCQVYACQGEPEFVPGDTTETYRYAVTMTEYHDYTAKVISAGTSVTGTLDLDSGTYYYSCAVCGGKSTTETFAYSRTVAVTEAVDSDGDGYVEIDSAGKLWWFTQQVNGGKGSLNAELTADIDLAGTCGVGIGNWMPIGNNYSGHFNGQGFTVSNLYMTGNEQYVGLFGCVKGATIENVTVTGRVSSTFGSVYDEESQSSYEGAAGGVVACLDGGTIRNCHVDMTVSGECYIGGICGYMDLDGVIENCTSKGTVVTPGEDYNQKLGGIVGTIESGTVRNCTNYASISIPKTYGIYTGGITVINKGGIENCINFSNLTGCEGAWDALGGIAKSNSGTIRNCANHGNISGYDVGGIVVDNSGAVENCYNTGTVSGTSGLFEGPISGLNRDDGTTTNNYYLSNTETEDGGRTAEQFASGQVAYELNGSTTTDESVWKQTLGTDTYPTLTGDNVYYVTSQKCDGTVIGQIYSDSSKDVIVHEDTDNNSFCDLCEWLIITEITFPDTNFRTYIAEEFDTDKDGLLSLDEIAAVTRIDVADKGIISDLSGVAYFTSLQYLYVYNNSLTTLDVSQNKALTILSCGQNQLTALDVSQNTELVELSCYENLFTSLDISANEKLEVLLCDDNPNLTSLKVNTAIIEIDVKNTALRSLDLSKCSQLEYLNYIETHVTSLELPSYFLFDDSYGATVSNSNISLDIDQKTMVLDLRDFVADVSRVTIVSNNATIVGNYLYISSGATYVNYAYDTGAAEGSFPLNVFININNPHTHSFDGNGYCADCGLQATIRVDVAFENKYFTTSSFADALALAREGGYTIPAVITLFDDVTVDEAVSLRGGTQILDLNGHKLTFTATNDTPFTLIAGTFTIRDSSTAQTGTMYHDVKGNNERTVIALTDSTALVLESGTLDFKAVTAAISVEDGSIMQQRGGLITAPILLNNGRYELDGGTIETNAPYAFIVDSDGSAWYYIEITGGKVSVNDTQGIGGLLNFPQSGCNMETVTITGGTFDNVGNRPFRICVFDDNAYVTVTGGTFEQGLVYASQNVVDESCDVSNFLAPGYAYYDADGNLVVLTEGQTEITGKVTVGVCTHSFGDYLSDAEGHWHECKACGATDTKLAHTPEADDGNCLTAVHCTACGFETTKGQIIHNFNSANLYDESGHWEKCSRCDETAPKFDHSFTVPQKDGTHHWNKCDECDATDTKVPHSGTDDGNCTTPVTCSCGHVITEAYDDHIFDNACDTDCNNPGCKYTRTTYHESLPDDGNCTTPIRCVICQEITTEAKEHSFDNTCDTTCNNKDCKYTRTITHTPNEDDGDCETAIHCKICDAITTPAKSHSYTNACDTTCNNDGCKHTRVTYHESLPDDGNCTTPIRCVICQEITTEAKEHSFDNTCDTTCNNKDCKYTRTITHTPNEDDGDCETAIHCKICDAITTPAKIHSYTNACDTTCNNDGCKHTRVTYHESLPDDGNCSTPIRCVICQEITTEAKKHSFDNTCDTTCNNKDCKYTRTITHTPNEDDGDCETAIHCKICDVITTPAKSHSFTNACDTDCNNDGCKHTRATEHRPEDDDDDCTTDILCSICDAVTTKGNEAHTGGTATCTAKAECTVCGTKYGSTLAHIPETDDGDCTTAVKCSVCQTVTTPANATHTGGTATCQAKANCSECGTAYGEIDENNHSKTTFVYTANADGLAHTKKYECCGVVALDSEAHTYGTDNTCVCGAEKPIPTYTVTVENGTVNGEGSTSVVVNQNGTVTVTANAAPEGQAFKGWSVNGEIVSTEQTYTFNATENVALKAVYQDVPTDSTPVESEPTESTPVESDSVAGGAVESRPGETGNVGDPTDDTQEAPGEEPKKGLSGGAIVAIVIISVIVLAGGGFAIYWFGFKKKAS